MIGLPPNLAIFALVLAYFIFVLLIIGAL